MTEDRSSASDREARSPLPCLAKSVLSSLPSCEGGHNPVCCTSILLGQGCTSCAAMVACSSSTQDDCCSMSLCVTKAVKQVHRTQYQAILQERAGAAQQGGRAMHRHA